MITRIARTAPPLSPVEVTRIIRAMMPPVGLPIVDRDHPGQRLAVRWIADGTGQSGRPDSQFIILDDPDRQSGGVQIHVALRRPGQGLAQAWRVHAEPARDPRSGARSSPTPAALAMASRLADGLSRRLGITPIAPPPASSTGAIFDLFGEEE